MCPAPTAADLPEDLRTLVAQVVDRAVPRALERAPEFEFAAFRVAVPACAGTAGPVEHELRTVIRHAVRDRLLAAWPLRRLDDRRPELIVSVQVDDADVPVWLEPQTAFVAGRYRKLARTLSQTHFGCRRCRGRGVRRGVTCRMCGGRGRFADGSVEGFVRPAIEAALGGTASAFHGSGREDVDVRMLGDGRPFVVSVEGPHRRSLDAAAVAAAIAQASEGRVEVTLAGLVSRKEMSRITAEHGVKSYRAVVRPAAGHALPADAPARVAALAGVALEQRTPRRVAAHRADAVRRRVVHALGVVRAAPDELVLDLRTDAGLYVKEFVSGDAGRTRPSVAATLGVACTCAELDVTAVGAPDAP